MSDRQAMELARDLVRGSIIEDAASRFISQVLKEAHDSRIKPLQDRIEELEAKLRKSALQELSALGQASEAYQAQLAAEAKLAKAVERFEHLEKYGDTNEARDFAADALTELTGGKDE